MIMLASLAATLVFGRKKTVDWKLLFSIVPLAILGSFAGGYVAQFVSVLVLKIIFAVVLIIAAFFMLRPATEGQSPSFMPQWMCWDRSCGEYQVPHFHGAADSGHGSGRLYRRDDRSRRRSLCSAFTDPVIRLSYPHRHRGFFNLCGNCRFARLYRPPGGRFGFQYLDSSASGRGGFYRSHPGSQVIFENQHSQAASGPGDSPHCPGGLDGSQYLCEVGGNVHGESYGLR